MKIKIGKWVIAFTAVFTAVSPYVFDWNVTHIYNPNWTPHAKFHNAQTMLLGLSLGVSSIFFLFRKKELSLERLQIATFLAAIYWITQALSLSFPGTALQDPEFIPVQTPTILGLIPINQLIIDFVVLVHLAVCFRILKNSLNEKDFLNAK